MINKTTPLRGKCKIFKVSDPLNSETTLRLSDGRFWTPYWTLFEPCGSVGLGATGAVLLVESGPDLHLDR